MDLVSIAQVVNPVLQTVFTVVIGIGYFYTIRATQIVQEMRTEHTAGGVRPLITVSENFANSPDMSLIVQNVGQGPAKDITFEFSKAVQGSDGQVLSDLPFFADGPTSLAPGAAIACYRDSFDNLLPSIKEGRIASDVTVTVRYKDSTSRPTSTSGT